MTLSLVAFDDAITQSRLLWLHGSATSGAILVLLTAFHRLDGSGRSLALAVSLMSRCGGFRLAPSDRAWSASGWRFSLPSEG